MAAARYKLAGAEAPVSDEAAAGHGLGLYALLVFVGGALVIVAAAVALSLVWLDRERQTTGAYLAASAHALADEMTSRTKAVRAQLAHWRDDPGLRAALGDPRAPVLRAKEEELALLVPGALGVHLFTPPMLAPGGNASAVLSYAGLDLARGVLESGETSPLEAHRVGQPDAHLAIAAPVRGADGALLGVVHVRLPLAMLPRRNRAADAGARYLFEQQVGGERISLRTPGDPEPPGVAAALHQPVPDTRLELAAWAPPHTLFSAGLAGWLGGVTAGAVLLLGLLVLASLRAQRQAVGADLDALYAVIDDAQEQRPLRTPRMRLAEFVLLHERLRRLLREQQPARPVAVRPPVDLGLLAAGLDAAPAPDPSLELDFPMPVGAAAVPAPPRPAAGSPPPAPARLPPGIFRAYDIRGRVGSEINEGVMVALGRALGSEARARGGDRVVVGRDQRPSSDGLAQALIDGLLATGVEVIDMGLVPTPMLYFGCVREGQASGAMVTGSHNPAEYNGLKVVLAGVSATDEDIAALAARIERADFRTGEGAYHTAGLLDDYLAAVERDAALARGLKVVIDCGHATAALVAPKLLRRLGCAVVELDCDCDGALADQQLVDPAQPRNLFNLGDAVRSAAADLGLGFDPDGDRLGVVDSEGQFIAIDRVLMLLAGDVLARMPGADIVYDVKCSHRLGAEVLRQGGRPLMWRSGHSYLKAKLREVHAPLAGELSGHIVFGDRWNGFDDAFYAAARLLEVLALDPRSSHEVFAALPVGIATPELFVRLAPESAARVMDAVLAMADRLDGVEVKTIDGLRAEFDQGWGLVRASNTQHGLVFRFEADDPAALDKIQDLFRRMMELAAPDLDLPF